MSCKIYSSLHENYADVKSYVKYNEHYYFLVTNCTGSWGPDYKVQFVSNGSGMYTDETDSETDTASEGKVDSYAIDSKTGTASEGEV